MEIEGRIVGYEAAEGVRLNRLIIAFCNNGNNLVLPIGKDVKVKL